jgi:hypothetical protein
MRGEDGGELAGHKTPILAMRLVACPRAMLGQATAMPPRSLMTSRRFLSSIGLPPQLAATSNHIIVPASTGHGRSVRPNKRQHITVRQELAATRDFDPA